MSEEKIPKWETFNTKDDGRKIDQCSSEETNYFLPEHAFA